MKKFISLFLAFAMVFALSANLVAFAENETDDAVLNKHRDEVRVRMRENRIERREAEKPKTIKDDSMELLELSATALKNSYEIELPIDEEYPVTVNFKSPIEDTELALCFYDEEYDEFWELWADFDYCYNSYDRITGVEIYYIDESELPASETEVYIYDYYTDELYGPIIVTLPPFDESCATAFKGNPLINLPMYDSYVIEFKTPLYSEDFEPYVLVDGALSETWVDYELIYDDDDYVTGLLIDYIDEYDFPSGTSKIYFYDWDNDEYYGPLTVNYADYAIYPSTISYFSELYFSIEFLEDSLPAPGVKYLTLVGENEDGDEVFEISDITPSWQYSWGLEFDCTLPELEDGMYSLSTKLTYFDNTTEDIGSTMLQVYTAISSEDCNIDYVSVRNRYINKNTNELLVSLEFNGVPNLEDIEISLTDSDDEVLSKASKIYPIELYSDWSELLAVVPVPENIYNDYYGEHLTLAASYNDSFDDAYVYIKDEICTLDGKIISSTERDYIITGLDAGEYDLVSKDNSTDTVGVLTVNADKTAKAVFDESYNSSYIYIVVDGNCHELYARATSTFAGIEDVSPAFIGLNATKFEGFTFTIGDFVQIYEDEIEKVELRYNDTTIATGTNITLINEGTFSYGRAETSFSVDFNKINMSGANDGDNVELYVKTSDNVYTYSLPVISSTNTEFDGFKVFFKNIIEGNGGLCEYYNEKYDDYDSDCCFCISGSELEFGIKGINLPSLNVTLFKYNEDTYEFEEHSTLSSSKMTKEANEFVYNYTGSFKNLTDGYYSLALGNYRSIVIKVTKSPLLTTYGGYYYASAVSSEYEFESVNVTSSSKLKAYYLKDGVEKSLSATFSIEDGYVYMTTNFGKISYEDNVTVLIKYNGSEAGRFVFYDSSNYSSDGFGHIQAYYNFDDSYLRAYSNFAEHSNPVLRIVNTETVYFTTFAGTEIVKEIAIDNASSQKFLFKDLDLEDGVYGAYAYADGKYLTGIELFGIKSYSPKNITFTTEETTSTEIKVTLTNNSSTKYSSKCVVLAGYDKDGTLVGAQKRTGATISANGGTWSSSFDKITDATTYDVFVWDSIKSMKPVMEK